MRCHLMTLCATVAAGLLLPAAGGCSTNPVTGRRELILVPRDQEIAMGDEAAPQFAKEFDGPVANSTLQTYVQAVGAKVAAVSDREMPYEYTLLASDVPNAFALPGGKIFVTAGLMRRMANERQLAAVLGHETGHVANRHNVKGMQRQVGVTVLAELAGAVVGEDKGKAAKAAAAIVGNMASLRYTRSDEYEADKTGITYMARAGYNPHGMVELLTVLLNMSESEPGTLTEMFQTHPLTSKRIEEAKGIIAADEALRKYSAAAPDPNEPRFRKMHALLIATLNKGK